MRHQARRSDRPRRHPFSSTFDELQFNATLKR